MYQILTYPDPILAATAEPVNVFDDDLVRMAERMIGTMAAGGVGLAAPQVGISRRVIVVQAPGEAARVLVNPEIVSESGRISITEGCLSLPDCAVEVPRSARITVNYQDVAGTWTTLDVRDLLAIILQHEIDHLDGRVLVDYL